ncbi:MAG: AAA family ATPase [Armatimonadota bacterium]
MPKPGGATTKLRGRVVAVFYASPTFSAGKLKTEAGDKVSFAGPVFVQDGDRLILIGRWVKHPKFGRQLEVESMEYDQDLDAEGLANYIAKHPDIKGIGPAKARVIAERFGGDFDRCLVEEAEQIAQAAHLPLEAVEHLRDVWQETGKVNQAMTALSAFGLTHLQVVSLVKKFGGAAVGLLKSDPYSIVRLVPGFGFKRIDQIAREKMNVPKETPGRICAGVAFCVEDALEQGHCWVEYEELIDRANTLLVMDCLDSRERIEHALEELISERQLTCFGTSGRFLVAIPRIREMEEYLAQILRRGDGPNPRFPKLAPDALDAVVRQSAPSLKPWQHNAVAAALRHSITLISGGAGSGKTYTISALVGICQEYDLSVILAAPTGKAAKRMEQVVGMEAQTIHRLLGYDGHAFTRESVDADVVVIDELSMVDVPLAWHLFKAIDLSKTAVVLVGDHNQLPPVGPGNLLRDLVRSRVVPTVILDGVQRQAGVLKENSIAILSGEVRKTSEKKPDGRRAWYVIDQFTDPMQAQTFILELFDKVLSERLNFDIINDVQVLTPTHKGPLGTRELNTLLQSLVQRKLWDRYVEPTPPGKRPKLMPGDKVIQTRNNYTTGVMNGAVGTVVDADEAGGLTIDFDGTLLNFENGAPELAHIQLAFALTFHKAQGSEYPCSIVVVHKSHSFMHHRNLLYTGVTRASESAIIVGDHWGIGHCAKVKQVEERKTFLSLLLGQTLDSDKWGK